MEEGAAPAAAPAEAPAAAPAAAPAGASGDAATRASAQSTAEMNVEQTKTIPQEPPGGTADCPKGRINIGIFFDGTGNDNRGGYDAQRGAQSNVAKLYKLYIEKEPVSTKRYFQGVGTEWYTKIAGGVTGAGGKNRSNDAYNAVVEFFNKGNNACAKQKVVDVYGFSRGAAIARDFVNRIHNVGIPDKSKPPNGTKKERWGKSYRDVPNYVRMSGVKIRMLGIFDTVSSFGMPGDNVDVGYNFHVNSNVVEKTAHAVSEDETRKYFPLQSIKSGPDAQLPPNMVEKKFKGVHSDVGGGYDKKTTHYSSDPGAAYNEFGIGEPPTKTEKSNDAARVPLNWMYEQSVSAGVEMKPIGKGSEWQPSKRFKELDAARGSDPQAAAAFKEEFVHNEASPSETTRNIFYQGGQ